MDAAVEPASRGGDNVVLPGVCPGSTDAFVLIGHSSPLPRNRSALQIWGLYRSVRGDSFVFLAQCDMCYGRIEVGSGYWSTPTIEHNLRPGRFVLEYEVHVADPGRLMGFLMRPLRRLSSRLFVSFQGGAVRCLISHLLCLRASAVELSRRAWPILCSWRCLRSAQVSAAPSMNCVLLAVCCKPLQCAPY